MPVISCEVKACVFNKEGGCSRKEIKVDGEYAKSASETECDSFVNKINTNGKNASDMCSCDEVCEHACKCSEIDCNAVNCKYNRQGECEAERINVADDFSATGKGSECATFEMKN